MIIMMSVLSSFTAAAAAAAAIIPVNWFCRQGHDVRVRSVRPCKPPPWSMRETWFAQRLAKYGANDI
jgi:hypothetical protein